MADQLTDEQVNLIIAASATSPSRKAILELLQTSKQPIAEQTLACAICITPYHCPDIDGYIETGVKTQCGHTFGSECLRKWRRHSQQCPLCRMVQRVQASIDIEIRNERRDLKTGEPFQHGQPNFFYRIAARGSEYIAKYEFSLHIPWKEEFRYVFSGSFYMSNDIDQEGEHEWVGQEMIFTLGPYHPALPQDSIPFGGFYSRGYKGYEGMETSDMSLITISRPVPGNEDAKLNLYIEFYQPHFPRFVQFYDPRSDSDNGSTASMPANES